MPVQGQPIRQKDTIVRPDVNYRELTSLNCSMIKLFDTDPVKFYEQFKLGKKRKDSTSTSLVLGDLVDFFLLECEGNEEIFTNRFEEKFVLSGTPKGTGQAFLLADTLFEITKEYINEEGKVTTSFATRFSEAFKKVQAMGKYSGKTEDWALDDFNDKALGYFEDLIDAEGKTVIDVSLLDKSKKISEILVTDHFTYDLFRDSVDEVDHISKFPIEWTYTTKAGKDIVCKSEIDLMKVDHKEKVIYLKDLKTTYDNENFEYAYIKYQYYLQAAFYYLAVRYWADNNDMSEYEVTPMEFVVADTSSNNRRPVRFQTSQTDLDKGLNGFVLRGITYRGVHELMEEITWCERNNTWNASKAVVDGNGIIKLNLKYE